MWQRLKIGVQTQFPDQVRAVPFTEIQRAAFDAGRKLASDSVRVKVSGQLLAMRAVFRRKASDDPKRGGKPAEQVMRKLLSDSPERFLAIMGKLEAEHSAKKRDAEERRKRDEPKPATVAEPDGGSLVGFHRAEEFLRGLT